jgi:histone H3/H4
MSFNKSACKRLNIAAGVERSSTELPKFISKIVDEYISSLLEKLINIANFAGRKTIVLQDVTILGKLSNKYKIIICPNNYSILVKTNTEYSLFTVKKPFEQKVRSIIEPFQLRMGKNVILLLQNMTEQYIITIIQKANIFTKNSQRDTLLPKDIESVFNYNTGF